MNEGLYRVVDANLNRAAEAIRVVEDLCRFVWNAKGFARELKRHRHDVFAAVCSGGLDRARLVLSRDTEGDVGRDHASPRGGGADTGTLALRNLERAREAVRALEEAFRPSNPAASARLESIRYALYELEKGIARLGNHGALRERIAAARVYLIASERLCRGPIVEVVSAAVAAGCDAVQLREKDRPDGALLELARRLREVTARRGALFFVNDRPDIAALAGADGVHCGQDDLPAEQARRLLPSGALVGISTHSTAQALAAQTAGADYLGVGPVFATRTKERLDPLLGADGLAAILEQVHVPAFAVGGIGPETLPGLRAIGVERVALSSALLASDDVSATVRSVRALLAAG